MQIILNIPGWFLLIIFTIPLLFLMLLLLKRFAKPTKKCTHQMSAFFWNLHEHSTFLISFDITVDRLYFILLSIQGCSRFVLRIWKH